MRKNDKTTWGIYNSCHLPYICFLKCLKICPITEGKEMGKSLSHTVWECKYHIVWVYTAPIIMGMK